MNKLNILIKLLLVGLIASLIASLYSCNNNSVTITKEEYNKLKGDTIKPEYPKTIKPIGWACNYTIITIEKHQFIFVETKGVYGGIAMCHYPDCKCKKDSVYLTK